MNRCDYYPILKDKYEDIETFSAINHTFYRTEEIFSSHDSIMISVSGGSDSDCIVHLVCTYFPEVLDKIHFDFVNTGLEYQATKNHLAELEQKYNISISRVRGQSVVSVCKEYGFPILSKFKSHFLSLYIRGFPSGEKTIFEKHVFHSMDFTPNQKKLAVYLKENNYKISDLCCAKSKKAPLHKFQKEIAADLTVTGERKAEGGQRSFIHTSCFEQQKDIDKFMPLFWWEDDVKAEFKRVEKIRYSDCYEKYGMRRTGCCGCPFNLNIQDDLQAMFEHEPQLFKACMTVFGESYRLMDEFQCRKRKCLPEFFQYSFGL